MYNMSMLLRFFHIFRRVMLAALLAILFMPNVAEAMQTRMDYHPTENAPEEMLAVVRDSFRDEIEKAERLYPEYEVQVLVILSRYDRTKVRRREGRCATCERMIDLEVREQGVPESFRAMFAGSPHFCDSRGCLLVSLRKKEEDDFWTGSPLYQSNGHMRFTDRGHVIVETRLGCEVYGPRPDELHHIKQPCNDWSALQNEEKSRKLWRILRVALARKKIKISSLKADGPELKLTLPSYAQLLTTREIVSGFAKDQQLIWNADGLQFIVEFDLYPEGLYYHQRENYPVRWVTE